jgi:hypothetical protein
MTGPLEKPCALMVQDVPEPATRAAEQVKVRVSRNAICCTDPLPPTPERVRYEPARRGLVPHVSSSPGHLQAKLLALLVLPWPL